MAASNPIRPTVRAGGWVAVSGQVGHVAGTIVPGGISSESAQAIINFVTALESEGFRPDDVVKTTVFLTAMEDVSAMNQEYIKVFGKNPPARSAVAVSGLPRGALVEIEGWAYRSQDGVQ